MKRDGHEDVKFFVGNEIENTPALGRRTLFVVGVQSIYDITIHLGRLGGGDETISHIYFGANQSFPNPEINDSETWGAWEAMIWHFLEKGYWCTLDVDVSAVEGLCEGALVDHSLFIPMISVKLPYAKQLGYNATIKLDDKDFKATNPGVWCHSLHNLMDRQCFTSWDLYTNDKVAK